MDQFIWHMEDPDTPGVPERHAHGAPTYSVVRDPQPAPPRFPRDFFSDAPRIDSSGATTPCATAKRSVVLQPLPAATQGWCG